MPLQLSYKYDFDKDRKLANDRETGKKKSIQTSSIIISWSQIRVKVQMKRLKQR